MRGARPGPDPETRSRRGIPEEPLRRHSGACAGVPAREPGQIRLERLNNRRSARRAKSMDGLCNLPWFCSKLEQIPDLTHFVGSSGMTKVFSGLGEALNKSIQDLSEHAEFGFANQARATNACLVCGQHVPVPHGNSDKSEFP